MLPTKIPKGAMFLAALTTLECFCANGVTFSSKNLANFVSLISFVSCVISLEMNLVAFLTTLEFLAPT